MASTPDQAQPRPRALNYAWVIWLFSTLGFLFSVPGQTMGMGVYTDYFIEALGLTRTQLSLAYLVGTLLSAFCLPRAGRLFDQHGGRVMIAASSVLLALVLIYISQVDRLLAWLSGSIAWAWLLMLLGYFGVRFLGQGVLTSASRNILLIWFVKRRGLVSGLRGVFVSFGFALAPLGIAILIQDFGWRGSLWVMAAGLFLFGCAAWLFVRNRPVPQTAVITLPETGSENEAPRETGLKGMTLAEARQRPVFWLYAASLSIHALFGTALTFHIVSIFDQVGRSSAEAFSYFLPSAICSTLVNLLAGYLADRNPLKPFLILMLLSFLVGAFGLDFARLLERLKMLHPLQNHLGLNIVGSSPTNHSLVTDRDDFDNIGIRFGKLNRRVDLALIGLVILSLMVGGIGPGASTIYPDTQHDIHFKARIISL
ncbi:MFS transporter [Pseudomonadales bacterium]|nr:MFS transporter [Pseudomonadales bacterium]